MEGCEMNDGRKLGDGCMQELTVTSVIITKTTPTATVASSGLCNPAI